MKDYIVSIYLLDMTVLGKLRVNIKFMQNYNHRLIGHLQIAAVYGNQAQPGIEGVWMVPGVGEWPTGACNQAL